MTDDRSSRPDVTTKSPIDFNFPRGPEWVPKNPGDEIEPTGGDRFDLSRLAAEHPGAARADPPGDEVRRRRAAHPHPARSDVGAGGRPGVGGRARGGTRLLGSLSRRQEPGTAHGDLAAVRQAAGIDAGRLRRPARHARRSTPRVSSASPRSCRRPTARPSPHCSRIGGWPPDGSATRSPSSEFSDPVTGPLAVSPDPTAPTTTLGGSGLRIDPATAWLFDYEEALERGMAITVPLTETAAIAADGVTTLVVIGVDEAQRPLNAAAELQALFEQHSQSAGLAFVPQGTPTNNTETVASGYRRVEAELADLEARELDVVRARCRRQRDAAGQRPRLVRRRAVRAARPRVRPGAPDGAGHAHRPVRDGVRHVRPSSCWRPMTPTARCSEPGLGDLTDRRVAFVVRHLAHRRRARPERADRRSALRSPARDDSRRRRPLDR